MPLFGRDGLTRDSFTCTQGVRGSNPLVSTS